MIWLCCPSAFNPAVGPRVVSDAGEPASPRAAEAAINITICAGLNPIFTHNGTNNTDNIGIVPKDVPIPIVINKPNTNIINDVNKMLFGNTLITVFIKASIAPDSFKTEANPAATYITNATYPIR